jgi:hypothetical protein
VFHIFCGEVAKDKQGMCHSNYSKMKNKFLGNQSVYSIVMSRTTSSLGLQQLDINTCRRKRSTVVSEGVSCDRYTLLCDVTRACIV